MSLDYSVNRKKIKKTQIIKPGQLFFRGASLFDSNHFSMYFCVLHKLIYKQTLPIINRHQYTTQNLRDKSQLLTKTRDTHTLNLRRQAGTFVIGHCRYCFVTQIISSGTIVRKCLRCSVWSSEPPGPM